MNKHTIAFCSQLLFFSCSVPAAPPRVSSDSHEGALYSWDLSGDRQIGLVHWPTSRPVVQAYQVEVNGPASVRLDAQTEIQHDFKSIAFLRDRTMVIRGIVIEYPLESPAAADRDAFTLGHLLGLNVSSLIQFHDDILKKGDSMSRILNSNYPSTQPDLRPYSRVVKVLHDAVAPTIENHYSIFILIHWYTEHDYEQRRAMSKLLPFGTTLPDTRPSK